MLATIATVQVVFTVALLAGATLLVRTASKLAGVRPGYETERILAVTVTSVTPGQSRQFHTGVLDRVAALPGVARDGVRVGAAADREQMARNDGTGRTTGGRHRRRTAQPAAPLDYAGLLRRHGDGPGRRPGLPGDRRRRCANGGGGQPGVRRDATSRAGVLGRQMRFAGDTKRTIQIVGVVADTQDRSAEHAGGAGGLSIASGRAARSRSTWSCGLPAIRVHSRRWSGARCMPSIRRRRSSASPPWRRSAGPRWRRARSRCSC